MTQKRGRMRRGDGVCPPWPSPGRRGSDGRLLRSGAWSAMHGFWQAARMLIDPTRLAELTAREVDAFTSARPRSLELYERARGSLLGGVPMPWMMMWAGGFPVFAAEASGARIVDVDGHEYVDLSLGDTGAMPGHGPPVVIEAVRDQLARGITTMLPTEDAIWVGEELARRFGMPRWLFTLTATDANRTALRAARQLTGRPFVAVFSYCYHGSVDEAFAVSDADGLTHAREGNVGPPVYPALTTRAIEFNDVDALRAALADGLVACVLAEPAMTNMGIILPEAGYHEALRELTREAGTLLIIDETHTFSAGPGGCTAAWGLEPDMLTIGKAIGSGIPSGALGLSARFAAGVEDAISGHGLPWHVTRLGCRAEYGFTAPPPRDGTGAYAATDHELERFLHLHALNRGVMITPFHNMALMSPATSADGV